LPAAVLTIWLHRRFAREGRVPLFNELLYAGSFGYTCLLTVYFISMQGMRDDYANPLAPVLIVMLAQCLHKAGAGIPIVWRRLALLPFLVWLLWPTRPHGDYRRRSGIVPLSLGEIRGIGSAFETLGYDPSDAYRCISSGQRTQTDFQSGIWALTQKMGQLKVLGGPRPGAWRVLVTAVPQDYPPEPPTAGTVRAPGLGRQFILSRYDAWVEPDRFAVVDKNDPTAEPRWRDISLENDCYGKGCLDPMLPVKARTAVRASQASQLLLSVRIPARGESRVLYLPGVEAMGFHKSRCAGRVVRADGLSAMISPDAHQVELMATGKGQAGTLLIEWPTWDGECFPRGGLFYPMPMAELSVSSFTLMRPYFD
jgi:hypothetical protein